MKYVLGLTGPTGSGKSTLGKIAEAQGWYVIDCDQTVRKAYENREVITLLAQTFGKDILTKDNKICRKSLAQKAFSSKENTELLNKTILPTILSMIEEEIKGVSAEKILLDAPTLYESGADKLCDAVCVLWANEDTRLSRITARDNLDPQSAKMRMSAGKSEEYYKSRTPHILYNNYDEETLQKAFLELLNKLGGN